jgi:hypothetical protein
MTSPDTSVHGMALGMARAYLFQARLVLQNAARFPYPEIYRVPEFAEDLQLCRAALDTLQALTTNQGEDQ